MKQLDSVIKSDYKGYCKPYFHALFSQSWYNPAASIRVVSFITLEKVAIFVISCESQKWYFPLLSRKYSWSLLPYCSDTNGTSSLLRLPVAVFHSKPTILLHLINQCSHYCCHFGVINFTPKTLYKFLKQNFIIFIIIIYGIMKNIVHKNSTKNQPFSGTSLNFRG